MPGVTTSGSVIEPASVETVSSSPSTRPSASAAAGTEPGDRPVGRGGEERLAVLQPAGVEQQVPRREDGLPRAGPGGRADLGLGAGSAVAVPLPELGDLGAGVCDTGQAEVDVHGSGQHVQHPGVGQSVGSAQHLGEGPLPALPVHERAGLLDGRRDRKDDVGALGHGRGPQLQAHDEVGRVDGRERSRGVGQVVRVDAADQQGAYAGRVHRRQQVAQTAAGIAGQ